MVNVISVKLRRLRLHYYPINMMLMRFEERAKDANAVHECVYVYVAYI